MSAMHTALIIEHDPLLREMVAEAFILHRPTLSTVAVESASEAWLFIEEGQVDIIVAGLAEAGAGAQPSEFLHLFENVCEDVPFVIYADEQIASAAVGMASLRSRVLHLSRPPSLDQLLEALDRQILSRRDTILHDISLPSFLQLLHHDRKTCTLAVVSGERQGHLFMNRGELVHAALPHMTGREAAIEILGWPSPVVRVVNRFRARQTISQNLTSLLLDWSIAKDHHLAEFAQ